MVNPAPLLPVVISLLVGLRRQALHSVTKTASQVFHWDADHPKLRSIPLVMRRSRKIVRIMKTAGIVLFWILAIGIILAEIYYVLRVLP